MAKAPHLEALLMSSVPVLTFEQHGAEYFGAAALSLLPELRTALQNLPPEKAGVRIYGIKALHPMLEANGPIGALASNLLGPHCRPVRAILFDKNPTTNWSLAWHQDRTICVKHKISAEGYGPWTVKGGMHHVEPPFDLLSQMVTLRIHLDDVPPENAPLLVSPGSHLSGRIKTSDYAEVVRQCGVYACLARAGDVWLYATPILHASEAASLKGHRRVLQIDYSAAELGGGLEWLGI